jgi:Bacterial Ig domain
MPGKCTGTVLLAALLAVGCSGNNARDEPQPAVNTAPVAAADSVQIRPEISTDIDVLANDRDAEGDSLVVELLSQPSGLSAQVLTDQRIRITPAADFSGPLGFNYRLRDARGAYSIPTTVSVTVGPVSRLLLDVQSLVGGRPRVIVADVASGQSQILSYIDGCANNFSAIVTQDRRRIIARSCANGLDTLIAMSPRERVLAPPRTLLSDVVLVRGMAIDANATQVTVAVRTNSADYSLSAGEYELRQIDTNNGSVVRRMALPGFDYIFFVRAAGSATKLFVVAAPAGAASLFDAAGYMVDMVAGTWVRVTEPNVSYSDLEFAQISAGGRFILSRYAGFNGELVGYDTTTPEQLVTFWTPPNLGIYASPERSQFVLDGQTLLTEANDFATGEHALWLVPLANQVPARELARFNPSPSLISAPLLTFADRVIYARAAPGVFRSSIHEMPFASGQPEVELTPAGGVQLAGMSRLGNDGLMLTYYDEEQKMRLGIIRNTAPGIVERVAGNLEADWIVAALSDFENTTIGFGALPVNGSYFDSYVVDLNQPANPVFVTGGYLQENEHVNLALMLGAPDP